MSNLSKTFSKIPPSFVTPQVTTLADDDPIDGGDLFEEGRDDLDYMSSINAVNINCMSCSPSADVYDAEPLLTLKDPDALRAQIDTGADVSCTDQLHMLHQYHAFDEAFPSRIKMMGGIVNSNAVLKGYSYLHIPAITSTDSVQLEPSTPRCCALLWLTNVTFSRRLDIRPKT